MTLMSEDGQDVVNSDPGLRVWLTLHAPSSSRRDKESRVEERQSGSRCGSRTRVPQRPLRSHTRKLTLAPNMPDDLAEGNGIRGLLNRDRRVSRGKSGGQVTSATRRDAERCSIDPLLSFLSTGRTRDNDSKRITTFCLERNTDAHNMKEETPKRRSYRRNFKSRRIKDEESWPDIAIFERRSS